MKNKTWFIVYTSNSFPYIEKYHNYDEQNNIWKLINMKTYILSTYTKKLIF